MEALRQILLPGSVEARLASTRAIGQDDSVLRLRVADVSRSTGWKIGWPALQVNYVVEATA